MPEARIKATPRLATSSALPASDHSVPRRTTQRARVRVVGDLRVQEVEDVLRVVVEQRRFFLDVGVVGVGVGRRGEHVGIDRVWAERRRDRAGVTAPASRVANACAPLSSCKGIGFVTATVTATLM